VKSPLFQPTSMSSHVFTGQSSRRAVLSQTSHLQPGVKFGNGNIHQAKARQLSIRPYDVHCSFLLPTFSFLLSIRNS
jgi:hypothetical protein